MNPKPSKAIKVTLASAMPVLLVWLIAGSVLKPDFWFAPDQRAQRLLDRGEFQQAAENARDPILAGTAWFEARDFKEAEAAFSRSGKPEAWFNLGNARVFLGKYEAAIEAYDGALAQRPDWLEAQENREIARLRAERTKQEGSEMGDQKIGADEIVFTKGKKSPGGEEEQVHEQGGATDDKQLQALWLRRLDTRPADFLKAKFSFQAAQQKEPTP